MGWQEEKDFQEARRQKLKDRQQDLEYAAKNKEEPGVWARIGQYPEDFALGFAENAQGGSGGNISWPTSSPTNESINKAYEKALQKAIQSGKVPSGWWNL